MHWPGGFTPAQQMGWLGRRQPHRSEHPGKQPLPILQPCLEQLQCDMLPRLSRPPCGHLQHLPGHAGCPDEQRRQQGSQTITCCCEKASRCSSARSAGHSVVVASTALPSGSTSSPVLPQGHIQLSSTDRWCCPSVNSGWWALMDQAGSDLLLLSHPCMAAARRTTSSNLGPETQLSGASDAPMPQHYYEEPNPDRSALHTDVIVLQPWSTFTVNPQTQL